MSKNTAVATKNDDTALALAGAFDDVDLGFGQVDSSDYAIPRLAILGDLSPQVKKQHARYIEGAEPGMIADVGMGELVADSVLHFLPVQRVKEWIEWFPRKSNKGIANRFTHDRIKELGLERNDRNEFLTRDGNEIIEHHTYFGLNLGQDNRWSFISMKKSNFKAERPFFTKATAIKLPSGKQAPLFFKSYLFKTFLDGTDPQYWNWKIEDGPMTLDLPNADEVIRSALALKTSIETGQAKADMRDDVVDADSDIPF